MFVVIDTNVIVSALLSKGLDSPPARVVDALMSQKFIPLYHPEIIDEYEDVLNRPKFHFNPDKVRRIIDQIKLEGREIFPAPSGESFVDKSDLIFYEVAMDKQDEHAWLVTGNMRHYPARHFIMTPTEFMDMLDSYGKKRQ
ncbi:MAG: putative toxin-antitoxin system toxin component, PIN family [Proteobacteria bacterium]|nr:putative toxin-antitoxin system toxin component, PIN family [Pseudomonadota bacterium]